MSIEMTQGAVTRYRQKAVEVEARQVLDDLRNHTAIAAWIESGGTEVRLPAAIFVEPCLHIETPDGWKRADIGDWIVRFPAGTFQVIAPGKFEEAFEAADEDDEAKAEHFARDASILAGAKMLGRIVVKQQRTFEAARIEMLQNGPGKAMQWILNGLPDVDDNPAEMQWDGKESADEWFERTADFARSAAVPASPEDAGNAG